MRNNPWPFPASAPSPVVTAAKYAGLAIGAFLLYKLVTRGVSGAAADLTRGAVGTVVDAGTGVVIGAGEAVGIPPTNVDQCTEDIYAGRTWDASFSCPAATFLRYAIGGVKPPRPGDADAGMNGYSLNRNC